VAVSLTVVRFLCLTLLNLTNHKLPLDIRPLWRGKVGVDGSSISGMTLEMSSKQVSQMSLMSIRWLPVSEKGSGARS
jgi:hypothetical protein